MDKSVKVLFAAVTGFVAGLLLAPKSGAENREEIRKRVQEAKERMDEKAGEAAEVVKEGAGRAETEARGMAESAKKSAHVVADEAISLGNEAKERIGHITSEPKSTTKKD